VGEPEDDGVADARAAPRRHGREYDPAGERPPL
jgi:hypothetical protein